MNTQQRIDKITEELRDIYKNTNEGPKLITEMVEREFPYPRKVLKEPNGYGGEEGMGGWGMPTTQSPR